MILCPLASGSAGNVSLVCMGQTRLLVDAGVSATRILRALSALDVSPESIDGVLITHEHADHVRGLPILYKKTGIPIYANPGTWQGVLSRGPCVPEEARRVITTGEDFFIGEVNVLPFAIPHDAADPVGYTFRAQGGQLSVATDLGAIREDWLCALQGSQALVLEANHDVELVRSGPYPLHLKQRILSRKGHLSNEDAGRVLCQLAALGTQAAFLSHLSEENNIPELAAGTVSRMLQESGRTVGEDFWLGVARRDTLSDMVVLEV